MNKYRPVFFPAPLWLKSLAALVFILLNTLLHLLGEVLELGLFFDSIFTVVAGALFGPLWGSITGLGSNLMMEVFAGFPGLYLPFAVVNMSSGFIAGFLAARGLLDRPIHLVGLTVILTLVNSLLGTLIVVWVFGGITGELYDVVVEGILMTGRGIFSSTMIVRLQLNVIDKGIAAAAAFLIRYRFLIAARKEEI